MADLWDRIRNVWDRSLEATTPPGEQTGAAQQTQDAQRLAAGNDVALEVAAALNKVRADIRKDWTQEALEQGGSPAELSARYQARIEDYNRVAMSLLVLAGDKLSTNVANVIHPEEMARGIQLTIQQSVSAREEVLVQSIQPSVPWLRPQEQLRDIQESWVQDLQSNQMRPAQADLYYAGRFDQFKESVLSRSEQHQASPELPAFSEVKAQVQEQLRQVRQQSESIAV